MDIIRKSVLLITLSTLCFFTSPAKALTSFYDNVSQKLVIEGVNLDQNFTLSESDLAQIISDKSNSINPDTRAFHVRFFFSPSVETQIINQIQANQDQEELSPSLEIYKNNDLRTYKTRVKLARVEKNKKSFGFLNYINPSSAVKLAISTEYTFDLHDFSGVNKDETLCFEFEVNTAETFSGNIEFKVSLNSIAITTTIGGSSVDNGSSGGSSGGGTSGGGSNTDTANPAIAASIDGITEDIITKLGDSYDAVDLTVICGETSSVDQVNVCDSSSLSELKDSLEAAKADLLSLPSDHLALKQTINTARQDGLLTKKEANRIKNVLDSNTKKVNNARKELNSVINKIEKKLGNGTGFTGAKAQATLQKELDSAKNKLSQAHNNLKNDVLRPLLSKNIISQESFDENNKAIEEASSNSSSGGTTAGSSTTTVSTRNLDGSVVVANADGTITTTYPDGRVETTITNDDGSISKETTYPDGSTSTTVANDDGSTTETITHPDETISIARSTTSDDGLVTMTTTTNPDGTVSSKTVVKNADGSTTTTYDDGSVEVKRPDGSVSLSVTNPDGSVTTTTQNADGTTTKEEVSVNSDGSISTTVTNSDGTTTLKRAITNEDGSVITTITITHPDGSITTGTALTNEDGSITTTTITNPDGTTTTKVAVTNADGSITTTTTNPDDTTTVSTKNLDGSIEVKSADGSITTITKIDGTVITKLANADGSFTVTTVNPDGTSTTSTEVINADSSVTTTTANADGSTTVSTAITNPDGTITTTTTITAPTTTTDGGDSGNNASLEESFISSLSNYSSNIASSFTNLNQNYVCNTATNTNDVDICDTNTLISFQGSLVNTMVTLKNTKLYSRSIRKAITQAQRDNLLTKREAKQLRTTLKRNNVRLKNANKRVNGLDKVVRARIRRGKTFTNIKANNFFLRNINVAKLRINRAYTKLRDKVVNPLFDLNLIPEEVRVQYDVAITEL